MATNRIIIFLFFFLFLSCNPYTKKSIIEKSKDFPQFLKKNGWNVLLQNKKIIFPFRDTTIHLFPCYAFLESKNHKHYISNKKISEIGIDTINYIQENKRFVSIYGQKNSGFYSLNKVQNFYILGISNCNEIGGTINFFLFSLKGEFIKFIFQLKSMGEMSSVYIGGAVFDENKIFVHHYSSEYQKNSNSLEPLYAVTHQKVVINLVNDNSKIDTLNIQKYNTISKNNHIAKCDTLRKYGFIYD